LKAHRLYLFNPDHDLALANGDENFNAPRLANTFKSDLSILPLWYAGKGSTVMADLSDPRWLKEMRTCFPQLKTIAVEANPDLSLFDEAQPWGWNSSVRKSLLTGGVNPEVLPDVDTLTDIRRLSHRKTAIEAISFLHDDKELSPLLPMPARQLMIDEVEDFARRYDSTVFKAPWSGSGRGLFWINSSLSANAMGWCAKVVEKQGSIIGEQVYNKQLDFAIEYKCFGGKVSLEGYSLFETDSQGIYNGNLLLSNDAILQYINRYIPCDLFQKVEQRLLLFIEQTIAPYYSGYLGVDMMVYNLGDKYFLHPCVEINLRMTMGLVARLFFDKFVHPECKGRLQVEYIQTPRELYLDHQKRQELLPITISDGLLYRGYLSLSPITSTSHYRIKVEIMDESSGSIDG